MEGPKAGEVVVALDFSLSVDQEAIADAFGAFFAAESPIDVVRGAEPLGYSPRLWQKLGSLEAPGMSVPPHAGGGGATLSDLVVVAEALGESIAPVPLGEHWVASRAYPTPEIVSGDQIAAIALRPADAEGIWRLVPGGAVAGVVVGVDGDELVAVHSSAPMVSPRNHGSAPLADRSARGGQRVVLGEAADLDRYLDLWRVLTAAALVGIAERAMRMGVDYVLERHQFGRPIGSFQSIQHGLADLPALVDGGRFLAHKAAWAFDAGLVDGAGVIDMDEGNITEFAPLAAMALVHAADAAAVSTDRSLHYHGGYGFSLEYDIQLYFRRARGWANIIGDPSTERRRLADLLWGPAKANAGR
ncbi:MAG: acyl-CoA dehydrogenase [Acidimicrobiaceae bacterium]|nr:acyl-CoA dehydrogenase [Acidimicrobiaceae bacterium]MXW74860.1 acyl-CoA dehydrogenase [Acidimicrobiaceae bacterium]MYC41063.1 acyl-CoA dehydrogenase [Acidimicrobiaceae bacterium]MYD07798.1 acyl-CoA dehydrogenase [Acidimicrobiaceae bacterium]MYH88483.1 acyl-CoA dehydrogenase [Acidimicrobiaceae bacterium]